jgi:hypothetical protein
LLPSGSQMSPDCEKFTTGMPQPEPSQLPLAVSAVEFTRENAAPPLVVVL